LKYYPIVTLIVVFRERMSLFLAVGLIIVVSLAVFWAEYHAEIAIGLPTIPQGPYNTDLFAAKNLPFLLGAAAGSAAEPSAWAPLVRGLVAGGVYSALVGGCLAICRRLLGFAELRV